MTAILVALLTASSTFAALWPAIEADVEPVVEEVQPRRAGCRSMIIRGSPPPRGTVRKGCSSARGRPCARRRGW